MTRAPDCELVATVGEGDSRIGIYVERTPTMGRSVYWYVVERKGGAWQHMSRTYHTRKAALEAARRIATNYGVMLALPGVGA